MHFSTISRLGFVGLAVLAGSSSSLLLKVDNPGLSLRSYSASDPQNYMDSRTPLASTRSTGLDTTTSSTALDIPDS